MGQASKTKNLTSAVALVRNGQQLVMSAGMQRAPMAFLRECVRQGKKDLRLVGVVGGAINLDLPLGAGIASSVETCSVSLGKHARTGVNFQRMVEAGELRPLDST